MAHTTTPAQPRRPYGERVTISDGIAAYARHLAVTPARLGRGWWTVRDHHGVIVGHTNRRDLVPALVAYTR